MVVIHPKDKTTSMLSILYKGMSIPILIKVSVKKIFVIF